MLRFIPEKNRDGSLRVLCLGAHGDDIEIGCGATILRLAREFPGLSATWVVFSADDRREEECRASAGDFLAEARSREVVIERFRDGFFPSLFGPIKERFEDLKREVSPDLVFTHSRDDAHQDHRILSELAWNTWRDHAILEYEIPKYDGDLGRPGLFVTLDEPTARKKSSLIVHHFKSQMHRSWFREDVFLSLMRLRGVESRSPGGYAEAFTCRKLAL
jgi:LmbE family N-acetylglucosaminyl deacetylase